MEALTLRVRRHDKLATLPTRAHHDDVGFDLYVLRQSVIEPGAFMDIATGISAELSPGLWGFITGRSSAIRKRGLLVPNGIIDPGFRGELFVGVLNVTKSWVAVDAGERLGQLIPMVVPGTIPGAGFSPVDWVVEETTELSETARGEKGFGSSGR